METALDDPNDGFRPRRRREMDGSETEESTSRFVPAGQPSSAPEEPKPRRSQLALEQINRKLALVKAIDELRNCQRLEFFDYRIKTIASNAVKNKLVALLSQRGVLVDPDEPDHKVAAEAYFDAGDVQVTVFAPGTLVIGRGRQELAYCHGPEIERLADDLFGQTESRVKVEQILRRFAE